MRKPSLGYFVASLLFLFCFITHSQAQKAQPELRLTSPLGGVKGAVIPLAIKSPSSGAVTFMLSNATGIATLEGNVLTLIGSGRADLDASISETDDYEAETIHATIKVLNPRVSLEIVMPDFGVVGDVLTLKASRDGQPASHSSATYVLSSNDGSVSLSGTDGISLDQPGIGRVSAVVSDDANFRGTTIEKLIRIFPADQVNSDTRIFGTTKRGGINNSGVIYSLKVDGSDYRIHHDFKGVEGQGTPQLGVMIVASNGLIYGLAGTGGLTNDGSIFEYDYVNNTRITLTNFSSAETGRAPQGGLLEASNGFLYGTTSYGGEHDGGTLFKFDLESLSLTKLADFSDETGRNSFSYLTEIDGKIYGATANTGVSPGGKMFEHDLSSGLTNFFKEFDEAAGLGGRFYGSLVEAGNGKYFGVTGNGTVFEFDPESKSLTKRAELTYDLGNTVYGIMAAALNGKFYFIASYGGANSYGSIIEFDPDTYAIAAVHSFSILTGAYSLASLTLAPGGKLYGGTSGGGANGAGVIFEFDPDGFVYDVKFNFDVASGRGETGQMLLNYDGKLYGTTEVGGSQGGGVLFSFDPTTGTFEKKIDFRGSEGGGIPSWKLTREATSKRIFSSAIGGTDRLGLIYSFDKRDGTYKVEFDLGGVQSVRSAANLLAANGKLYGMTGSIFEVNSASGGVTFLDNIGTSQIDAARQLTQGADGMVYGVSVYGGANHRGAIFQVNPSLSGGMGYKHNFDAQYGQPATGLLLMPNGKFYGMLASGGSNFLGAVYSWDPATELYAVEKVLDDTWLGQFSDLAIGPNGNIWGFMNKTDNTAGRLFEFDLEQLTITIRHDLPLIGDRWWEEPGNLISAGNALIGSFKSGGDHGFGFIFSYDAASDALTIIKHFNGADGDAPTGYHLDWAAEEQELTFDAIEAKVYLDEPFELSASASSGLPVTFTSSDLAIATIDGNTVTIVGAGTAIISASAESSYFKRATATRTLTVAKAEQSIIFDLPVAKTVGGVPFDLVATATSQLLVDFSTESAHIAISDATVTIVSAGKASVVASQAGNANYLDADPVEQSFCINPTKATITAGEPGEAVALTSSASQGNQWYKDGEPITDATNATYTANEDGSYSVKVSIEECVSDESEGFNLIVTGIPDRTETGMKMYPNPVVDIVAVDVNTDVSEDVVLEVFDMMGRIMLSRAGKTNVQEHLDLTGYTAGVYRVVARSQSKRYSGTVSKK